MTHDPTWALLLQVTQFISDYIKQTKRQDKPVITFYQPEQLVQHLDLSVAEDGSTKNIIEHLDEIFSYSTNTQHALFFNQLYAGADIYGIIAEQCLAVVNTSMATYEIAPVFTLMETTIFKTIAELIGRDSYDALMLPGGSLSNQYAIQLARYRRFPEIHTKGMYHTAPLHIYTSDQGHYSITKAAQLLWIGKDNVIVIETNEIGQMIPEKLEIALLTSKDQWAVPLMINATSGTTVLGAYDPLDQIADIAQQYNVRLHIDMIWWGSVLLSTLHRHHIAGCERADSFSRNPHKMLGAPLQCSIFMSQHADLLATCNTLQAAYLFQDDKGYPQACDTGDKYVQCGRRADILKLRLQRKMYGTKVLWERVDTAFANARLLANKIASSDRFFLIQEPSCTNVCFWYLPTRFTKETITKELITPDHFTVFHHLTAALKQRMLEDGKMMISYQTNKWLPNFFRMVLINPAVTESDIDAILIYLEKIWRELEFRYQ